LREARVQGRLEHPAIVPVYDLGLSENGEIYFTMKRVRGRSLEEMIASGAGRSPVSLRRLLTAFQSVCLAVEFAHARGVVHRDLKPSNIMIGDFGEVYVLDWGIAKVDGLDEAPPEASSEIRGLRTLPGDVLGTPGYMAPEQARGESSTVDGRADVYSLGAILFEILTGEPLHRGETHDELLLSTLRGCDARASQRAPDRAILPELDEVCVRATKTNPDERFASPRAMHDEIERFLAGDRDMQRRRELADEHATIAKTLAKEAANADESTGAAKRKQAMREVGRALALDPTQPDAVSTLVGLLMNPPKTPPPDVLAQAREEIDQRSREASRPAAWAFLLTSITAPIFAAMGVRNWWLLGSGAVLSAAAAAICFRVSRVGTSPLKRHGVVLCALAGLVCLTRVFGPFLVVPQLALALMVGLILYPNAYSRWLTIGGAVTVMVLPVTLEAVGVFAPSYAFGPDALCIRAQAISFPPIATTIHLVLISCGAMVITAVYLHRVRTRLEAAQMRLRVYAWQLRQIVPDGRSAA
jgi:serine/threonine-protein kinase